MGRRLGELAGLVEGRVVGDPDREIHGIRPLPEAEAGDLSFLTSPRYRGEARATRAGALLVAPGAQGEEWPEARGRDLLVADDTSFALARLIETFHPPRRPPAGVHETAVVAGSAWIDATAHVGPYAVVGEHSRIEAEAVVAAHVVIGDGCRIGRGARLFPHAVLYDDTEVGERVRVHAGTVLGADGFGYATRGAVHHKVPQVGRVVLEDDVEIGALSAVDRATLGETRIGAGSKVDNLVQVGHNVRTGRSCILCGQAGIAGSSRLGDGVVLAGQAGLGGHLTVGDRVQVAAKSALLRDAQPGERVAGIPAVDLKSWRRQTVLLSRLGDLGRRLAKIEARLAAQARDEEAEE